MRGVLLDTHVLVWTLATPDRLGPVTRGRIQREPAHYSSVSLVELTIKQMKGKITLPENMPAGLAASGLTSLPLADGDAMALREFPELDGHDPFDRMLVAQASTGSLGFLTVDRLLLGLGYDWIIDAAT